MRSTAFLLVLAASICAGQKLDPNYPTWWAKYQYLLQNAAEAGGPSASLAVGPNVNVSTECGPQSETYISLNPNQPKILAAGSNEIFRLPMRGYSSTDGGVNWGGVDLPLPPPLAGTNDTRFGSDPTLAFDTQDNVFYGYIVVFFSAGNGIKGTQMAVARSTDGGKTYPTSTFFAFESGSNHFNDKPMITADTSPSSPFRDRVYIAWDAAAGGSSGGGVRVARSADQGQTFAIARADNSTGPGKAIGAVPFVGPNGEAYVAWNDYEANTIAFNRSFDGGQTWGSPVVVADKALAFDAAIPAEQVRGALVYPACDTDRSAGRRRGRLYCSWMDLIAAGVTDILLAYSDDRGATWSKPRPVTDQLPFPVDRFNQWLSVDPVTGDVNVSFYDTRHDTTGARFMTDIFLARSSDAIRWPANVRVSSQISNEHDCNGLFPCLGINYGNQQGDYSGLVAFGGVAHPIWTDTRDQMKPAPGCRTGLAMEEVFTASAR